MDRFARGMALTRVGTGLLVVCLHLRSEIGEHPGPHGGGEAIACPLIKIFVQCQGMLQSRHDSGSLCIPHRVVRPRWSLKSHLD